MAEGKNYEEILVPERATRIYLTRERAERRDSWIARLAIVSIHPCDSRFPFDIALAFMAGVQWRR